MNEETYKRQKAFAGEKKPSMLRRCVGHDYTSRQMYMVTMVVEGRQPLFGQLVGKSEASKDSADAPTIELTALGRRVESEWWGIPEYYPQIEIVALQIMPDHLHGILFVKERMEKDLSWVIRGFKTGCNRAYRELVLGVSRPDKLQVQCSRRLTDEQIEAEAIRLLALARKGAVLVFPSISRGEKRIMRTAFDEGLPLIILQENGFTDLAKPGGKRMEACARGQLLLLAPWEHHNERQTITRNKCLSLNELARMVCEQ